MSALHPRCRLNTSHCARPLRVCHVAYTFYENDNRVMRYAEALAERGDEVEVIALRRPGQPARGELRGVRVRRIQQRTVTETRSWVYLAKISWFMVKASVVLAALQLRRRHDIVHVHNIPDFLVFAAAIPKLLGARVILDIHDILPELYAGKFESTQQSGFFKGLLLIERLSCGFADHVIVANDLWRRKLIRRSTRPENCTTMLNYPDLRIFRPLDQAESHDKYIIMYPGSLNKHQGLDIAIKAFALAKHRMPDAEFHIYGEGPTRGELGCLIRESGVEDRVRLLAPLPLHEIARVMARADLAVVPKRATSFGNEAFSTKILEFMACGVPVVVSRTRIDAHYFDETVVRFFTPGDEVDLSRVLAEAYDERSHHADWIAAAHQVAVRNSWQERVGDYEGLIESLLSNSSPLPQAKAQSYD